MRVRKLSRSWDTPERRAFGGRIRDARLTRYPSQDAFASALKVASPYISQIESGRRIPSDELLCEMADLLPDALEWSSVRLHAHRLRSPVDLATLLERENPTPEIRHDPLFHKLRKELEQSDLPTARLAKLIDGWLEEIEIVRKRLTDDEHRRIRRHATGGKGSA